AAGQAPHAIADVVVCDFAACLVHPGTHTAHGRLVRRRQEKPGDLALFVRVPSQLVEALHHPLRQAQIISPHRNLSSMRMRAMRSISVSAVSNSAAASLLNRAPMAAKTSSLVRSLT